jgi:hypothetical protein
MIRTICSGASSDCKRLTKHENKDAQGIIARSENVCNKPVSGFPKLTQHLIFSGGTCFISDRTMGMVASILSDFKIRKLSQLQKIEFLMPSSKTGNMVGDNFARKC